MPEKVRDVLSGPPSSDYLNERMKAGWTPIAMEWSRPETIPAPSPVKSIDTPYGFRVAPGTNQLEPEPQETTVLYAILEEIVRDRRFTQIADELNRRKLTARNGRSWTPSAVFDLLPELIQAGPLLLKSEEWRRRRPHPAPEPTHAP
jgi:hypothetical protein